MKTTIIRNGKRYKLDQSQLIQAGGEGMVFQWQGTAVKLYHQPTAKHQAKIRTLLQRGLSAHLPVTVFAPCQEITNEAGAFIGFQMPLLPPDSQAVKRLSNPVFCQKHSITGKKTIPLLQHIHTTLSQLHQAGIIMGDLNDTNLFFTPSPPHPFVPSFIDVDSYQFAGHPCPVAMPAFLDPQLYGVADFGTRPYFSEQSDWYAFSVLLVKTLLGVHPYGGTHPTHKSLQARATARLSIFDTAVTYPQNARPLDTLSDDLLHHLHGVFALGKRPLFPPALLAHSLRRQPAAFSRQATTPTRPLAAADHTLRELYTTSGFIEQIGFLPHGRIQTIVFENDCYKLVRLGIGGRLDEMMLFNGRAGTRFALFGQFLAVNPPQRRQLLILDVKGSQPQQLTLLETAVFQDTAVFAATPDHLYRIAGNWLMRGSVQQGHYVEEMIGSTHKNQTWFQASPYSDIIAGVHRIFAENRYFVQSSRGTFDLQLPPPAAQEFITGSRFAFGRDTVALGVRLKSNGRLSHHLHTFDHSGRLISTQEVEEEGFAQCISSYPITQLPAGVSETAVIHPHPAGLLIQEPSRLLLAEQSRN